MHKQAVHSMTTSSICAMGCASITEMYSSTPRIGALICCHLGLLKG